VGLLAHEAQHLRARLLDDFALEVLGVAKHDARPFPCALVEILTYAF
jgi:hypothetical protein